MPNYEPPPTYADPVIVDEVTRKSRFNPVWLKWFLDLATILGNLGADLDGIDHNSLGNIQGGSASERFHLTSAQQTDLTDAGDSTSHFHASDRNSANFTGTNWTDLTDGGNTTLHTHSIYELLANKDAVSGYAGLNATSRITKGADTTDDLIVDLAAKGLVLKDTQGTPHYWRVTISTLGALVTTDLGTTKP